jgi:hypothetical protein
VKERADRLAIARKVSGLGAVPAGAQVVLGLNVGPLAASPLVRQGVRTMLARDPGMAARLAALSSRCHLDPARDLSQVVIAMMGPTLAHDVVLVAQGKLDEPAIVTCVRAQLEPGGGSISPHQAGGLTVYIVHNPGGSDLFVGFGAPGTMIIADGEPLLLRALDPAVAKLPGDAEAMSIVGRADTRSAVWFGGRLDPAVGQGLMVAGGGKIKAPAHSLWGHLALGSGLELELGARMASEADATAAVDVARQQIKAYAVVAQGHDLGQVVNGIKTRAVGDELVVTLTLDAAALAKLEALLDKSHSLEGQGASP